MFKASVAAMTTYPTHMLFSLYNKHDVVPTDDVLVPFPVKKKYPERHPCSHIATEKMPGIYAINPTGRMAKKAILIF